VTGPDCADEGVTIVQKGDRGGRRMPRVGQFHRLIQRFIGRLITEDTAISTFRSTTTRIQRPHQVDPIGTVLQTFLWAAYRTQVLLPQILNE
jgi:hypothetical protein